MQLRISVGFLQSACIIIVCAWALLPQLAYDVGARILSLGSVCAWLLLEAIKPRGIVQAPTVPVALASIFILHVSLAEYLTVGSSGLIRNIQLYIMLFFLFVQQSARYDYKSLTAVFWAVIVMSLVAVATTLFFISSIDARAMRAVVRSSEYAKELVEQGVGGYSLAYGAVLMMPGLLALSLRPSLIAKLSPPHILRLYRHLPLLLVWVLTFFSALLVIGSQFGIAVLAMVASLGTVIILWRVTIARMVLAFLFILFTIGYGAAALVGILETLRPFVEGTNYDLKIRDIIASFRSGDFEGTAAVRFERYARSIGIFLQNPIAGAFSYDHIGKHSTILDSFAQWGAFVGGVLVYLLTFLPIRAMRSRHLEPGSFGVAIGTLVATLLVFGLNKQFLAAGIMIYLVFPLISASFAHAPEGQRSVIPRRPARA